MLTFRYKDSTDPWDSLCDSLCFFWPQVGRSWGPDLRLVIAGLTGTYSSYVTTREEYSAQRYEGASTIFGPSTLNAYIQVSPRGLPPPSALQVLKPQAACSIMSNRFWEDFFGQGFTIMSSLAGVETAGCMLYHVKLFLGGFC